MTTEAHEPLVSHEFVVADVDTPVLVERYSEAIVIRLSRDTFSPERKRYFLRELAAEGFIPEELAWNERGLVAWRVDPSWLLPDPRLTARSRRLLWRCLFIAVAFWAMLMGAAVLGWLPGTTRPARRADVVRHVTPTR